MNTNSRSLAVPLTFPSISELHNTTPSHNQKRINIWDASFSTAKPSTVVSWSTAANEDGPAATLPRGAVVGCRDGSLYVFHPTPPSNSAPAGISTSLDKQQSTVRTRTPSHLSIGSHHHHRHGRRLSSASSNSSGHLSPFHITAMPQTVSGVNTEQVSAPKTHVDFDDEPDKLKDILKGRSPRDRTISDNLSPHTMDKGVSIERIPFLRTGSEQLLKRKDDPRSLLSATNSPTFTPRSISRPTSPTSPSFVSPQLTPTDTSDLYLRCHIIPPRSGTGRSVTEVKLLSDNHTLAVLQEIGDLSIFRINDGACIATTNVEKSHIQPPGGMKDREASHDVWIWKKLLLTSISETTIIVACATVGATSPSRPSLDPSDDDDTMEKTRLVVVEFLGSGGDDDRARLEKVGEWYIDGPAEGVELHLESDNTLSFIHVSSSGHLNQRQLRLLPRLPSNPPEAHTPEPHHHHHHLPLPLPNPFKSKASASTDHLDPNPRDPSRIALDPESDLGELLPSLVGLCMEEKNGVGRGLAWSTEALAAFEYAEKHVRVLFVSAVAGVCHATWVNDESYVVTFRDRGERYTLRHVDANGDDVPDERGGGPVNVQPKLMHGFKLGPHDALHFTPTAEVFLVQADGNGQRQIICRAVHPEATGQSKHGSCRVLWSSESAKPTEGSSKPPLQLTSMLPLEVDLIILGYSGGCIRKTSFARMAYNNSNAPGVEPEPVSDIPLDGFVTGLHLVYNERTKERFVIGGADDGSVAFWELESLRLCACWTVFTTPLTNVIRFQDQKTGTFHGCVLCCSQDGTIAVIAVDGFQFLYVIPGSQASLLRVCLGGDNFLLMYSDGRARLWDIKTREFWRSMAHDKAEELLGQGGWADKTLEADEPPGDCIFSVRGRAQALDAASSLILDCARFLTEAAAIVKSPSSGTKRILSPVLDRLRSVLSAFLTLGLNEEIDGICRNSLLIPASAVATGFSSRGSTSLYPTSQPHDAWCISADISAARALIIVAILRVYSLFEDTPEASNAVVAFYSTSLPQFVGPSYQPPSLAFLARYWFEPCSELRHASRILFDARVSRLTDDEANTVTDQWQTYLPCLQPDAERESLRSALALFLCGYIAAEKYSLFSASALTDIAKSIAMYLHDENSRYRVLAIDLCSRGFETWQHYVDAMEILRALFTLGASSRKESISAQNIGPQARLAILQIASNNTSTSLFMTTLALDIHSPHSVEHRKSVMQIFAFLIRKRPLVLYPNLPRLMEAVVKSLDPNSTAGREAVLDTATEILGHVVKTFPTIDFHMNTQRLAVGTSEGAIIMYDLKTATRLYVLENHKKRLAACTFSPDGRRLVTVSLEEGLVLVWKVGSSFTSFFNPGAPPRQGHAGSDPFKTLPFNVGEDANMTIAGTLEFLHFEWPADRSVRLKIRESVLTFST